MLTIRLLGRPAIERDGQPARAPRGKKAWALLCYLVLAERPPSRRHLAELLFQDAADPLGALRWTLAELRRALGRSDLFGGDPVSTGLDGAVVDVDPQSTVDTESIVDTGGELLEGIELGSNVEFGSWLLVARHRVSAAIEARLHDRAVTLLAAGRTAEAIDYASRAVARNPLEQGNHELLVRSLALAGDRNAALRQIAACEDLLRRELGVEASPALRRRPTSRPIRRSASRPGPRGGGEPTGSGPCCHRGRCRRRGRAMPAARGRRGGQLWRHRTARAGADRVGRRARARRAWARRGRRLGTARISRVGRALGRSRHGRARPPRAGFHRGAGPGAARPPRPGSARPSASPRPTKNSPRSSGSAE
jgi:DNA-binding SARP family transcriptional activator